MAPTKVEVTHRRLSRTGDTEMMMALANRFPGDTLHVADLPYRLSSWGLDDPDNVGLWVDREGQLIAWAVMQTPFWTIDAVCHPDACRGLYREVLDWADGRARALISGPSGRPAWYVNVLAGQTDRMRDLQDAGFVCQTNLGAESWSKVLMRRAGQDSIPLAPLPKGFVVRPLSGADEAEAYVDLQRSVFGSTNMTIEWRRRMLRHPDYAPELDLVAVTPQGRLAAFCVCWLDRRLTAVRGQVEPLGVDAAYRRLGLGRAILAEGLRRLGRHGAQHIYVETDNYRDTALALYEWAGFRVLHDVLVYRKDYGEEVTA